MSVQSWWRGVTVADPVFAKRVRSAVRSAVFLASMVLGSSALAQTYDVVLQGGRVMDPETGLDATRNVGISKNKIVRISSDALAGRRVIDVRGLVVAPGFIDLHQHAQDADSGRLKAFDGVTSALEMEIGVPDVAAFLRRKAGHSLINYGTTASHAAARAMVFGAPVSEEQLVPPAGEMGSEYLPRQTPLQCAQRLRLRAVRMTRSEAALCSWAGV